MTGLPVLVAVAEDMLAEPLNVLVTAVLDGDHDPAARAHLNAAAQHVSLALTRLARIESSSRSAAALGPGGAEQPPAVTGERLAPGYGAAADTAVAGSGDRFAAVDAGAQPPTAMGEAPRQGHVGATTTASGGSDRALVDPGAGAGAGGAAPGFPGAAQAGGGEGGNYRGLAGRRIAFREGRHRPVGLVDALPKN